MSRHINFLALTLSCLYDEVLHEGKCPRHLYILLEAWLEMNKLIFAWQNKSLISAKKCPVSFRDPRSEKTPCVLHISNACLSGCLASIKTPKRFIQGCSPKSGKVAVDVRHLVSGLVD